LNGKALAGGITTKTTLAIAAAAVSRWRMAWRLDCPIITRRRALRQSTQPQAAGVGKVGCHIRAGGGGAARWQLTPPAPSPGTSPTMPPDRQAHSLTPGRGFAVPEKQVRASTTPQRYQQRPLGSDKHSGPCCRIPPPHTSSRCTARPAGVTMLPHSRLRG